VCRVPIYRGLAELLMVPGPSADATSVDPGRK